MSAERASQCLYIGVLLLLCAWESRAKEPCHGLLSVKIDAPNDKIEPQEDVTMEYDSQQDISMKYETNVGQDVTMKYGSDIVQDVPVKYGADQDVTMKYDTGHDVAMKYGTEKDVAKKNGAEHDVTTKYDAEQDATMKYNAEHDVTMKYGQSHPSSHKNHIDPSVMVFFHLKDLKVGNKIPIFFPKRDRSETPPFLSREEADIIPFSSKKIPDLLHYFSIKPSTPQAKAMENTLRHCEAKPIKGEIKFCATSLDSMLDFVQSILGSQFVGLNTVYLSKPTKILQNYTVLRSPTEILSFKMVACHILPYPYSVYYCHSLEGETKVLKVSLGGENGGRVEVVAVCHMDTSHWGRNHVSFRLLGIERGTSPVCHFFPAENTVWIPKPSSAI